MYTYLKNWVSDILSGPVSEDALLHAVRENNIELVRRLLRNKSVDLNFKNEAKETALHIAAMLGHTTVVEALIAEEGVELNSENEYGETPLHRAALCGHTDVVKIFLTKKGITINPVDTQFRTPLHLAANNGHVAVVEALLAEERVELNLKDEDGDTPLHIAVKKRNVAVVKSLLENKNTNPNLKNHRRDTPIHIAIANASDEIVEILLAKEGIDPNLQDESDFTPLHLAAHCNRIDAVKMLLARDDVKVNLVSIFGDTPLHIAAEQNCIAVVEAMVVKVGVDLNVINESNLNPLHIAVVNGYDQVVKALIVHGADLELRNRTGETPLHVASRMGHDTVVKILLAMSGININSLDNDENTPIHAAAKAGRIAVVEALLENKETNLNLKNISQCTPIDLAAEFGHANVVEVLLKKMALYNPDDSFKLLGHLLIHASAYGQESVVKMLIDQEQIDLNYYEGISGCTPLHHAAMFGQAAVIKILLAKEGVNVNPIDSSGDTPLHLAVRIGHVAAVEALIAEEKTELNLINKQGQTPLHGAVKRADVIKILLAKDGVNTNPVTAHGYTPLHLAAINGHVASVEALIAKEGVDPNSKDRFGKTPLHWAAQNGHDAVIEVLLTHKCIDLYERVEDGWTALKLAEVNGHVAIATLLEAHMPKSKQFAVHLLNLQDEIVKMEELRLNGVDRIDDDEPIKRAHYYFNEKVLPHYKKEFENYGATDKERVKAIESKIREHILNIILNLPDTSQEIRSFIDAYKEGLIQGEIEYTGVYRLLDKMPIDFNLVNKSDIILIAREESQDVVAHYYNGAQWCEIPKTLAELHEAQIDLSKSVIIETKEIESIISFYGLENQPLKESETLFRLESAPAFSAWRCYNPYVPHVGDHFNLLTEHKDDGRILSFSTQASREGIENQETNFAASNEVRKRVAYYYLAATDQAYPDKLNDRIQNFFFKLSQIRNAHGLNQTSCYPGTITHISEMGKDHPHLQLGSSDAKLRRQFYKQFAVEKFKEVLACGNDQESENLLESVTILTTQNAADFLKGPNETLPNERFQLREKWSASLCGKPSTLRHMYEINYAKPGEEKDDLYFKQFQLDPGRYTSKKLSQALRNHLNIKKASEKDIAEAAGRFMEGTGEARIYTILFKATLTINADLSVLQLKEVVDYLSERTISIARQRLTEEALKPLLTVVGRMMGIEELPMGCLEATLSQFEALGLLKPHNPYPNRIALIEKQLKNNRLTKESRAMLEQRLESLKAEAEQFEISPFDPEEILRERAEVVLSLKRKADVLDESNDNDRMDEGKEDKEDELAHAPPEKRRRLNCS